MNHRRLGPGSSLSLTSEDSSAASDRSFESSHQSLAASFVAIDSTMASLSYIDCQGICVHALVEQNIFVVIQRTLHLCVLYSYFGSFYLLFPFLLGMMEVIASAELEASWLHLCLRLLSSQSPNPLPKQECR